MLSSICQQIEVVFHFAKKTQVIFHLPKMEKLGLAEPALLKKPRLSSILIYIEVVLHKQKKSGCLSFSDKLILPTRSQPCLPKHFRWCQWKFNIKLFQDDLKCFQTIRKRIFFSPIGKFQLIFFFEIFRVFIHKRKTQKKKQMTFCPCLIPLYYTFLCFMLRVIMWGQGSKGIIHILHHHFWGVS